MRMGKRWSVKLAVCALALTLALVGKVLSQEKPAPRRRRPPRRRPLRHRPSRIPRGTATGGIADVTAKEAGKPTLAEVAEAAGHNKVSINLMWTLLTGFLVMFMQAGFALVETGFTRAKNVAHTMMMNFMVYAIGMTGYWIMGFALQMGGRRARIGDPGRHRRPRQRVHDLAVRQGLRALRHEGVLPRRAPPTTSPSSRCSSSRWCSWTRRRRSRPARWPSAGSSPSFVVYGFFISMIIYPLFANWVWGGGWLSQLGKNFGLGHGHVDFAGSSVVHMVGGVTALAGAMVLGPRIGKYNKDGTPNPIPGPQHPDGASSAASSSPSAGSASTRAARSPAPTCASRSSRSTPCWRRRRARSSRCSTCGSSTASPTRA